MQKRYMGRKFRIFHDRDPKHQCESSRLGEQNIQIVPNWPGSSLDLYPIEMHGLSLRMN